VTAPAERDLPSPRIYRLAPLDRTGVLLGLGATQCLLLGLGVFAAGAALQAQLPAPLVGGPIVIALALGFATWDSTPLHQLLPGRARFLFVGGAWCASVPLLRKDKAPVAEWPPFLGGIDLVDHDGIGVIADRRGRLLTASITVSGREFSLAERGEQDRILDGWGEVLNDFCRERGAVCRVRVTEWAGPAGTLDIDGDVPADTSAIRPELLDAYRELLAEAALRAVRHDVLISITVDRRRTRASRHGTGNGDAAVDVLRDELAGLSSRLDAAGFSCSPPLGVYVLAKTIRTRLDPTVLQCDGRPGTLAEAAGVAPWNAAPLSIDHDLRHLRADGSVHRAFWIGDWPRLDQGPNWLEPLLLHAGGTRTFALHYEPVTRSRSQRRVDRDSTRLAADEEHRSRAGFRIGASHRRAQSAVAEREAELVAGFCELEYAGFVVVTAADLDTLERSCAEYEQAAAQLGLQLRPLDGSHDLGVAAALPVARGVALRWSNP
jgi:hypothetical protein